MDGHTTQAMNAPLSSRFCSADADVCFRSCDNVIFRFYRKNLEVHSEGFAVDGMTSSPSDVVTVTETSAVLDLLLQFMSRQPQPDMEEIAFAELAGLAEAAEKYQVYSAMQLCNIYMRKSISEHGLAVLDYATKHGYMGLADEAALHTVSDSCTTARAVLSLGCFYAWLQWKCHWHDTLFFATKFGVADLRTSKHGHKPCTNWARVWAFIVGNGFATQESSLLRLDSVFDVAKGHSSQCPWNGDGQDCSASVKAWRIAVEARVREIPKFSTFI
ncbi:hypothetical protein PLICRDRAFT_507101 [Plicaturopsis crispa FD-325 SS-3]|nr:hypothetical protein PLICRDRAFT_507101 [Plicaturopsis crispa FD-325 SS-3]